MSIENISIARQYLWQAWHTHTHTSSLITEHWHQRHLSEAPLAASAAHERRGPVWEQAGEFQSGLMRQHVKCWINPALHLTKVISEVWKADGSWRKTDPRSANPAFDFLGPFQNETVMHICCIRLQWKRISPRLVQKMSLEVVSRVGCPIRTASWALPSTCGQLFSSSSALPFTEVRAPAGSFEPEVYS